MSLCLAAGGALVKIAAAAFTLSWTHSVEKTVWQEDWAVRPAGLELIEARIQGSGAGMDPPPDARLEEGFYVWDPDLPPVPKIVLRRRARQAGDWRLCAAGRCATLGEWLGGEADPVTLRPCPA